MESVVTKISAAQRMDMIMKGLNPRDPKEVNMYLKGGSLPANEKVERAKILFEGSNSLGSGHEKDVDVTDKVGMVLDEQGIQQFAQPSQKRNAQPQDYRQALNEEMESYGANSGKTFSTDDLMSFRKSDQQAVVPQGSNLEQVKLEGFNASKQYLNAFVLNLQTPSYQTRLALYKMLLACLKGEEKYKNNSNALEAYRAGVKQAEVAMLQKLQG